MKTKIIRFNLKDRGRQYRGKDRNFNIRAVMDAINGPECQERVRNRDMHGFYGHLTRVKFGMIPNEGVMDGSDTVPKVIPAFITTYLKAFPDGTVEHKAEFLKTGPGQVAENLYSSRAGGFSTAIKEVPAEFFGLDYVLEPNYTSNRGYALDSVAGMTLDDVDAAILDEQLQGMLAVLDSVNAERNAANEAIERLQVENEELLSMLAAAGGNPATLDSAGVRPLILPTSGADRMRRDAERFRSSPLISFIKPANPNTEIQERCDALANRILSR